jgi:hypothetical protein
MNEIALDIDPQLAEEAVSLAMRRNLQSSYWQEREALYEIEEEERREAFFVRLNRRYFAELSLGAPIAQALDEQPEIARGVQAGRLLRAMAGKEEGAELFVDRGAAGKAGTPDRLLILRLVPRSLLSTGTLLLFLRHELFHIADMLDPAFQYDPEIPEFEGGAARLKIILNRYRVLWDTVIDGRLWKRGQAAAGARELRWLEFRVEFAMLGDLVDPEFKRWFDCDTPAHPQLLKFAAEPLAACGRSACPSAPIICPVCRGLGPDALAGAAAPPESLLVEIHRDAPGWRPDQGICRQCLDLFRSRPLSRAAAGLLPRV